MKSFKAQVSLFATLFLSICWTSSGFTVPQPSILSTPRSHVLPSTTPAFQAQQQVAVTYGSTSSNLSMARDDEGPGLLASIGILLIMIIFVGTGLLPLMDGGGDRDLSIADSVVTRQDVPTKLQNFESKQDRLSRATIQEKLSSLPVFYISEGGSMKTDLYLSYADAVDAASGINGASVKVTSLDQVM